MKIMNILKERKMIALLLLSILFIALVNSYFSRRQYDSLAHNVGSIYADRLIPVNYLYKIHDYLYQKKTLVHSTYQSSKSVKLQLEPIKHDIDSLIKAYEATYLTDFEKQEWKTFVRYLNNYEAEELAFLKMEEPGSFSLSLQNSFDRTIQSLHRLNEIQLTEGLRLESESKKIINSAVIQAYLEVGLLFILGIMALMLLTTAEKTMHPIHHRYMFN